MQVLILALGANRGRGVAAEAAQVVADGGRVVVLVDQQAKLWRRIKFAKGVRVVDLRRLESTRLLGKVEQVLLYRGPRKLFRVVGRGPLHGRAQRASGVFETRVADPVHRRLVQPLFRRGWGDGSRSLIRSRVLDSERFDLIVVADPTSMPYAAGLLADYQRAGGDVPRFSFGIDYAALSDLPAGQTSPGSTVGA
ncbi:hypothetical protein O7626_10385 [Micromonospora sp. WMMD1102]|uniref:hypothetical protein n=1 Tax=Micromonospora sp. WMMD1102 TaxID=3016105 RepID=UPI0024154CF8|nr:hypothetical protein [Micromonospora sp. WMMD1102]MDG4786330.1 hypothetical protein [Micromonospora sp. WMMD1102]